MAIELVQQRTECLFARQARLVTGHAWREAESFQSNLERQAAALASFTRTMEAQHHDGFCIELPAEYGATVDTLAVTVNRVLRGLAALDPSRDDCFREPVETERWRFRFGGEIFFVVTFASCYGEDHARFTFGVDQTLILLLSDHAFSRYCPPGQERIPAFIRDRIRVAYAQAGRIYDMTHVLSPIEAHRFVKPLRLRQPSVRWWEHDEG